MSPNDADGMANSVDTDLHRSGSALFAQAYLSKNLGSLCYIFYTIHVNPPGSSGSLPEMQPDSCTPGSETEPLGCENKKK